MQYRVEINTPLLWISGDRPDINGFVFADNGGAINLLGITLTLTRPYDANFDLLPETITTSTTNGTFQINLPSIFTRADSGRVLVSSLPDAGVSDTLAAALSQGAMTALLTTGTGMPTSGWAKIDSEWMPFTRSGTTLTFSERGTFRSGDVGHLISTPVYFSTVKSTAIPYLPYKVTEPQYIGTAPSLSITP